MLGRKPSECGLPEGLAELLEKQVQNVLETGKPSVIEFSVGKTDPKHYQRTATGLVGADGKIDRVFCHIRQIPPPNPEVTS